MKKIEDEREAARAKELEGKECATSIDLKIEKKDVELKKDANSSTLDDVSNEGMKDSKDLPEADCHVQLVKLEQSVKSEIITSENSGLPQLDDVTMADPKTDSTSGANEDTGMTFPDAVEKMEDVEEGFVKQNEETGAAEDNMMETDDASSWKFEAESLIKASTAMSDKEDPSIDGTIEARMNTDDDVHSSRETERSPTSVEAKEPIDEGVENVEREKMDPAVAVAEETSGSHEKQDGSREMEVEGNSVLHTEANTEEFKETGSSTLVVEDTPRLEPSSVNMTSLNDENKALVADAVKLLSEAGRGSVSVDYLSNVQVTVRISNMYIRSNCFIDHY